MKTRISSHRVRELLCYCPNTGELRWKVGRQGTGGVGSVAGNTSWHGYREVRIDGILHKAHRLAWLYVYGADPDGEIDHIDGDRANNRLSNLRCATRGQNTANRKFPRSNNMLGVPGVSRKRKKYEARLVKDGETYRLGVFETVESAAKAYREKHLELWGEFSSFYAGAA
jgi:hypothetical protein